MAFFRSQFHIVTSLGTGLMIGIVYWRMTNRILLEIQRLSGTIAQLQAEVLQLKDKLQAFENKKRYKSGSGFFSLRGTGTGSYVTAEDEDDVYEEAYGGSELEYQREIEEQIIQSETQPSSLVSGNEEPQITGNIFKEIDRLFEGPDAEKEQAYSMLQNNQENYLKDVEFFWRFSKSTYQMSQIEEGRGNTEKRKSLVYAAKELAETAVSMDDTCASAHKWFAITVGSMGEFESTQDKIKNGFLYKEHIEKAVKLKPNDPSNHYLLGRWCYSVYMLSWIERKAAAALFATPPTATIEDSLKHFLKADELNPGKWKGNSLFVAKCYVEMRRYKEAKKWLESAKQIPVINQDDKTSEEEVQTLLYKYGSY